MNDLMMGLLVGGVWIALQVYVLPRLGVST